MEIAVKTRFSTIDSAKTARRSTAAVVTCVIPLLLHLGAAYSADPATDTPTQAVPSGCDIAWERIKGLPPLSKVRYEAWLREPRPQTLWPGAKAMRLDDADMYYYMARVPFVIGAEQTPSVEQRDEWLQKAAEAGHKAANAALMRMRYLGPTDMDWLSKGQGPKPLNQPQATRVEYLKAARLAAEVGDPEFATVMMDTARNINGFLHCQSADKDNPSDRSCKPQEVTKPIETSKWAEIAGQGGNPNAMELMCRMYVYGTFPQWGFNQSNAKAFPWCFALDTTPCRHASLLEDFYTKGVSIPANPAAAAEHRHRYPTPYEAHTNRVKPINFPFTSR